MFSKSSGSDNASVYKVRIGAYMVILYALVYFGFIVINNICLNSCFYLQ